MLDITLPYPHLPFGSKSFFADFTLFWVISAMNFKMQTKGPDFLKALVTSFALKVLFIAFFLK